MMALGLTLGLPFSGRTGTSTPTTANAQLVLNKTKKTGFTYWIRML